MLQLNGLISRRKRSHREEETRNLELISVMGAGNAFLPVYVFFVVVCAYIIYPGIPRSTATAWIGIYLLYTSIRTVATYLYHDDANRTDAERVTQWRRFVFCSAFTHGIILGSLAVIALPILAPTRQLLLTCFVLLVTTGAILYVSAILPALLILIFAALMPFVMIWQIRPGVFELPVSNFLLGALFENLFLSVVHYRNNSKLFFLLLKKPSPLRSLNTRIVNLLWPTGPASSYWQSLAMISGNPFMR